MYEDELSDLFRRIPVPMYRTSPDGELLAANTALANLLGYETVEELRSATTNAESAYVDPSARARWLEEIYTAGIVYEFDIELRRTDGTTVWVQDTARAIRDDSGNILYFEGALIDVTEKVRAKAAKDEFIATVSHELRNPIAAILGLGEELAKNYESFADDERRELAQMIARQADDASWLIEDLLVVYREDYNGIAISARDFDLTKEAERVLEVVDRPVDLEVGVSSAWVSADPLRTRQIIRNLVSNALRYGGEQVLVRIEPSGDRIELSVCDSGDLIDQAEVERIFKPFQRGQGKERPESVGLGLSVARKLARLMEGDLTYRHRDGFSCFVLSLPAA